MVRHLYYILKPGLPRNIQILLHKYYIKLKRPLFKNIWPIDEHAAQVPMNWKGWPENKKFALILTHDVELNEGQAKCYQLAELEKERGFRSSFNFVPERYPVSKALRDYLTGNGFEVGVHGLRHDGKLYASKSMFDKRAVRINHYLKEWDAVGFRSPAMHHKLDWLHALNISYDASTFDTDPFEPQPDGVKTIFPFRVPDQKGENAYLEMPYTLPQDSTLFLFMEEKTIDVWKRKLDWVVEKGGMVLLNTHPDYMNFEDDQWKLQEYPASLYAAFLNYIETTYSGYYWHVLPREMADCFDKNRDDDPDFQKKSNRGQEGNVGFSSVNS